MKRFFSFLIVVLFLTMATNSRVVHAQVPCLPGDANGDLSLDVSDAVMSLSLLFVPATQNPCTTEPDVNGDTVFDLSDAIYTLNYLFQSGPAPMAPTWQTFNSNHQFAIALTEEAGTLKIYGDTYRQDLDYYGNPFGSVVSYPANHFAYAVSPSQNGDFYILAGTGASTIELVKLDAAGNILWNLDVSSNFVTSLVATSDGGVVVAGSENFPNGDYFPAVAKISSDGMNVLWQETWNAPGDQLDQAVFFDVQNTSDGGFILAGGEPNAFLAKIDDQGARQWTQTYADPTGDWTSALRVTEIPSGGFAFAGGKGISHWPLLDDLYFVQVDANGAQQNSRLHDFSAVDNVTSIRSIASGGFILTVQSQNEDMATGDLVGPLFGQLVRLAANGDVIWSQVYSDFGTNNVMLRDAIPAPGGGFLTVGSFTESSVISAQVQHVDALGAH